MYIEMVGGDGASELVITEENDLLRDLKSIDDVVKKIMAVMNSYLMCFAGRMVHHRYMLGFQGKS